MCIRDRRLDIERVNNIEYLPCEVISAANDKADDIDYLPCDETGIAADVQTVSFSKVYMKLLLSTLYGCNFFT